MSEILAEGSFSSGRDLAVTRYAPSATTGMATFLVSYDLNRPGQQYAALITAIKSLSSTWWHHLDSTWVVVADASAKNIRDALTPHLDANDELLVVKLDGEGAWRGFSDRGAAWLKDHL